MVESVKIKQIMTRKVISCKSGVSIKDAAVLMKKNSIGVLVVIDDKKLVGVISERDIINKVVTNGLDSSITKVKDVMTKKVITGNPEMTDLDVAETFAKKKIKKLPIVNNGKVVGIITQTDIMKLMSFKWAL